MVVDGDGGGGPPLLANMRLGEENWAADFQGGSEALPQFMRSVSSGRFSVLRV